MELLRKLVMVAVAGLIGWGGQATGWAGAMLPRYRIEDMGLVSQYDSNEQNPNLRWLSDGTVYAGGNPLDSTDKLYRKGEYLRSDTYSSPGVTGSYVLKKDGSDVNILEGIDPKTASFDTFASSGKAIFSTSSSQFIFDATTGQRTNFPNIVGTYSYGLRGINGLDEMVGTGNIGSDMKALYYASIGSEAAFLSTLVDDLGQWKLRVATDINDSGEIIGWGHDYSKSLDEGPRVFKLIPVAPVPEPSTWMVFGFGSLLIFLKFRMPATG